MSKNPTAVFRLNQAERHLDQVRPGIVGKMNGDIDRCFSHGLPEVVQDILFQMVFRQVQLSPVEAVGGSRFDGSEGVISLLPERGTGQEAEWRRGRFGKTGISDD